MHVLFILHFVHWKLKGRTLAPLEFNEVLYTVHQGIVTAGFILMALVMLATALFGRFFCSWCCHILALQDASRWLLAKVGIEPRPLRSRTLVWVPVAAMFYLFIWPQVLQVWQGLEGEGLHVVEASGSRWSSFTTDDLWRNLPPPGVAILTFFVCGFLMVYLLGSRGFCYHACPYGALFGLADQVAPGRIVLAKDCSQCGLCTKACSSDILVHRELALHGMVTDPRCLKDLDCVAACPENAVQFGFRTPPLFRKGNFLGTSTGRFRNSIGEDILLVAVFLPAFVVWRGAYDLIPFLLAVALAGCTAFMLLALVRTLGRDVYTLQGHVLKLDGRIRPAGRIVMGAAIALIALLAHTGWVQYHGWMGGRIMRTLAMDARPDRLASAIAHFERALDLGLIAPIDHRLSLASLRVMQHQDHQAIADLRGIITDDPGHVEARYRLGELLNGMGAADEAMELWQQNLLLGDDRSGTNSRALLIRSALSLAEACKAKGDLSGASKAVREGLHRAPGDVSLLVASGELAHRMGSTTEAIGHFETALSLGGPEEMLRNNLAALRLSIGDNAAAIGHLTRLVELRPNDNRARVALASAYVRVGQRVEAYRQLGAASDIDPGDERIREALAWLEQDGIGPNDHQ
ncbi:MAG: tetratricopeptide repeat protein [Flavobacteriales bacterium]|nr:tetratricopeptide repeat protein [Flavobacteriales bacterium]